MKVLRIYSLTNKALTEEQCLQIQKCLKLDLVIQVEAENQLNGLQYPVFEFEEIYESDNVVHNCFNISRDAIKVVYEKEARKTPERNTSL